MDPIIELKAFGLSKFLSTLSSGSAVDRKNLSLLSKEEKSFYSPILDQTLELFSDNIHEVKAQVSLIYISRFMWDLVPDRIFCEVSPNFEKIARTSLIEKIGEFSEIGPQTKNLSRIMKRIRNYYVNGRKTTNFDLRDPRQNSIYDDQMERCNICLYQFKSDLGYYDIEDDEDSPILEERPQAEGEVCIERYFRKPELDHIIPFMIGGDTKENWQILCKSCNSGKGNAVSYFMRSGAIFDQKLSDVMKLSSSKRYSVLAKYRENFSPTDCTSSNDELRIFKKKNTGTLNIENLAVSIS
jgi:hypothetical protein